MQRFFSIPSHQRIDSRATLVAKAKEFCVNWRSNTIKQAFIEDIDIYAAEQEMAE